jgi:hypothetical protein
MVQAVPQVGPTFGTKRKEKTDILLKYFLREDGTRFS